MVLVFAVPGRERALLPAVADDGAAEELDDADAEERAARECRSRASMAARMAALLELIVYFPCG